MLIILLKERNIMTQKPVMLLILDGWGYRQPVTPDNAIENGHTPNWHS